MFGVLGEIFVVFVLCDLCKEMIVFVLWGVRWCKVGFGGFFNGVGGMIVNVVLGVGEIDEDGDEIKWFKLVEGEGFLGKLSGVFGGVYGVFGKNGFEEKWDVDDDY